MQNSIRVSVASGRILRHIRVRIGNVLDVSEALRQLSSSIRGTVLQVHISSTPKLLLDHQRLLEQLETTDVQSQIKTQRRMTRPPIYLVSSLQEFVLDLKEVAFSLFLTERLVYDRKARIHLNVLIAAIAIPKDKRLVNDAEK